MLSVKKEARRYARDARRTLALLGVAVALPAAAARAQFTPVAGTASGQITLGSYNVAPGGPLPFFNGDGQMLQPGGNFPRLNGINTNASTVVGGLPLATASGPVGNYGGGAANLFALGGGRAGIVSTNYRVSDFNVPANGVASATTLGGTAQWVNTSGFNLVGLGGGFGSVRVNLGQKGVGSYAAFGIDALIQVGVGVGAGFIPVNSFQSFIAFAYDGINAPTVFLTTATPGGTARFISSALGPQASFAGVALDPILVPAGATVRMTGTLTLYGDPADVDFDLFPTDGSLPLPNFGPGGAANADAVVAAPEPGSLCLAVGLLAGGTPLAIRRRRRAG